MIPADDEGGKKAIPPRPRLEGPDIGGDIDA